MWITLIYPRLAACIRHIHWKNCYLVVEQDTELVTLANWWISVLDW
jgi:hypothetical protein